MHGQYDVVAAIFHSGHIGYHHITSGSLGNVLRQFAAVDLQALPFPAVSVDAHIADLATIVDTCAGITDRPARRKLDTKPASITAKFQFATGNSDARCCNGAAGGLVNLLPEAECC